MEKRKYCTPTTEVIDVKIETLMLAGSYGNGIDEGIDVGGEILPGEDFDAKDRGGLFFYEW